MGIINKRDEYIYKNFIDEAELLSGIRGEIEEFERPINISPLEGKLIQIILNIHKTKNLIEIGTHCAYSAIWFAKVKGINITTIEQDKKRAEIASNNIKKSGYKNIILKTGKAEIILKEIENKKIYDAIFIDADKNNYLKYLEWSERNIKKGGLIIADNTLLKGSVYGINNENIKEKTILVMREFNKILADSTKYEAIILPIRDGLTIAVKKF